jgi:hypothetical protein
MGREDSAPKLLEGRFFWTDTESFGENAANLVDNGRLKDIASSTIHTTRANNSVELDQRWLNR